MYDTLEGAKTSDPGLMRIAHAKNAVRTFLESMTSPSDRVGLVAFNTRYLLLYRAHHGQGEDRRCAGPDQEARPR